MDLGHGSSLKETSDSAALVSAASLGLMGLVGITVDKSVEFSYEDLATATDNFSLVNKIGQGGFGSVYYAELRGEVYTPVVAFHHRKRKIKEKGIYRKEKCSFHILVCYCIFTSHIH